MSGVGGITRWHLWAMLTASFTQIELNMVANNVFSVLFPIKVGWAARVWSMITSCTVYCCSASCWLHFMWPRHMRLPNIDLGAVNHVHASFVYLTAAQLWRESEDKPVNASHSPWTRVLSSSISRDKPLTYHMNQTLDALGENTIVYMRCCRRKKAETTVVGSL